MPATLRITPATARRFLALRHYLAPPRSLPAGREGILTVFERFGSIQFDPLEVAGRNHDLVLLARVPGYRRESSGERALEGGSVGGRAVRREHVLDRQLEQRA